MVKAFIFDVDGTLVDTRQLHIDAWRRAFKDFGLEIPAVQIQAQLGRRAIDIVKTLLPGDNAGRNMNIVEAKWRIFREYYEDIRPIPKTEELFKLLKERDIALALATSANRQDTQFYVGILSLKGIIGAVVTGEDIQHSKPHPEIFLRAAAQLGIGPEESVVVGDSPHDMEAASKAGMTAVGVLTGGYTGKDLQTAGADKIYQDIEDLYDHIEDIL